MVSIYIWCCHNRGSKPQTNTHTEAKRSQEKDASSGRLRWPEPQHMNFLRSFTASPAQARQEREINLLGLARSVILGIPLIQAELYSIGHELRRLARDGHLPGLLVPAPGLRSRREPLLPPGGLPGGDGVELHLLVAALLAAEGRVALVHEDVAVARERLGAERARVLRRHAGLAERLGVEEEEGAGR
ncbi:hypothetical protein VPH35_023372 [Triticum aestivum]